MKEALFRIISDFYYLFSGTYTEKLITVFLGLVSQLLPFVIGGIFLTTILNLYVPRKRITSKLNKLGFYGILIAAILGAVSPLGTYALIPFIAALIYSGVTIPPLVAFLVSSPLINPFLFLLTYGALGIEMALMRLFASLFLGIVAGLLSIKFISKIPIEDLIKDANRYKDPIKKSFKNEFISQATFILRVFSISIVTASLVSVLIPEKFIRVLLSGNYGVSILLSVAAGIPMYACGGGSIPVIEVLFKLGMSKGAVLAFFISGPATKVSTIVALFACIKKPLIKLYLGVSISGAIIFGLLYDFF